MGNKNFIEINGKKYDAVTGKMVGSHAVSAPSNNQISTISPTPNSGVMDGFVRRPQKKQVVRTTAKPLAKTPQKSQTLMRKSVHKPAPVVHKVKAEKPVIHKSQLGTSVKREQIALQTPKSSHVQKYGEITHRTSVVKVAHADLTVKPEPQYSKNTTAAPIKVDSSNVKTQPSNQQVSQTATQKMLDKALHNATSHTEQAPVHHKKKRNKLLKKLGISNRAALVSSAVLVAVLVGGFFAVQHVPDLSMRLAATRAGFEANMPGYQPTGFSFKGPINYSPGQVVISFKSNTDNRSYDVKQRASNWNSDALLSNYIVAEGKQYQTYQDRGRTLYIYDGSNATWVDDGVWYQIEGESNMTTDQLIRIAASI